MSVVVLDIAGSARSSTLQGRELIEGRRRLDVGEVEWFVAFDQPDNGANPGVEAELIASAAELTNEELERAVRYARGLHEQDKNPADRYDRRGVSRCCGVAGGIGRLINGGTDDDIETHRPPARRPSRRHPPRCVARPDAFRERRRRRGAFRERRRRHEQGRGSSHDARR